MLSQENSNTADLWYSSQPELESIPVALQRAFYRSVYSNMPWKKNMLGEQSNSIIAAELRSSYPSLRFHSQAMKLQCF